MNRFLFKYCALCLLLILFSTGVWGEERAAKHSPDISSSEFDYHLKGYIEGWLFYEYALGSDRVAVDVKSGVVTLDGIVYSDRQMRVIPLTVRSFKGVTDVISRLQVKPVMGKRTRWQSWSRWVLPGIGERKILFPKGDVFAPPLADPKQPRFYAALQRYHPDFNTFNLASVGFGEEIGLVRWPGEFEGDGLQLGISGGVLSIFNLDSKSKDLMNVDYIIGFPLSIRKNIWSGRVRIYHQSSHLGDEFLLSPQIGPVIQRVNLSYEALEFLGSWEKRRLRIYGGYSRILKTDTPLDKNRLQNGFEYRFIPSGWQRASFISGVDMNGVWKESGWSPDVSVKLGSMFHNPYDDIRSLQLFLEYYNGHSPHGQFSSFKVHYYGIGFAFAI